MVNLGEAYRKLIGKTNKRRTKDEQKTNKISSPQPSPKERECSNGKVGRTKDDASRTGR